MSVTLAEQRDTIAGPEAQVGDKNTSGWSKVQTQVGDVDGDENENENENANTLEHQVKKPALPTTKIPQLGTIFLSTIVLEQKNTAEFQPVQDWYSSLVG